MLEKGFSFDFGFEVLREICERGAIVRKMDQKRLTRNQEPH